MTHFYNYKYTMPDYIYKAWLINWYHPIVIAWKKTLLKRQCSAHGTLSINIGWYGCRAQCLACKVPDQEEEQTHFIVFK